VKWLLPLLLISSMAQAETLSRFKKHVYRMFTTERAVGTGFAIKSPKGKTYLITNWHVCYETTTNFMFAVKRGDTKHATKATIISMSPQKDLCLLQFEGDGLKMAETSVLGSRVISIGHPHVCEQPQISVGNLKTRLTINLNFRQNRASCPAGFRREWTNPFYCIGDIEVIDTDLKIAPGSSGSPVINMKGEVVGVINSITDNTYGSMIPIDHVRAFMDKL